MNKTLCLINGITPEKIRAGLEYAQRHLPEHTPELDLYAAYMHNGQLDQQIGSIIEDFWRSPAPLETALAAPPADPLHRRGRIVIMQSFIKEHVFTVMRGIKNVSSRPNDIIFAMVTETALTWSLEDYIEHLQEEHERMKQTPPQQNPDMKKM